MTRLIRYLAIATLGLLGPWALGLGPHHLAAQQDVPFNGTTPRAPQGLKIPPLPEAPVRFETGEGQNIKVSVYARGFQNPWSMAWVSDDTMLVAERGGTIKIVRNGVVDPQPVAGAPRAIGAGLSGTDLALHPDFERNHYVYISYTKPIDAAPGARAAGQGARAAGAGAGAAPPAAGAAAGQGGAAGANAPAGGGGGRGGGGRGAAQPATLAVARAVWNGKGFTDVKDIFVGEGSSGGPIVFGGDGMLYVAHGGGDTQSLKTLGGKILRLTDEGKVPPDNPFVGRADARPEIFTQGHRTFLRMAKHPLTGQIWQIENGPNGGDEVNVLVPGANYGWPLISLGRSYPGPWQGPFTKEGFRDPVIYWMPAIAVSSITFYTGDKLPKWKGDVFVSGMRYGEIPGTGRLDRILINKNYEELRRETLLGDLHRRIRDVKQGRDGLLYVATDEADAAILKIEPAD
ncbi:MAG TPA: PQQ-dependent sugar dehydrogenase [Vicinamibacterales bacterium]|jgi:glucose/arabinose dehydrogenase|nr:PQQ-dependent sugar dehydrogenase [Vicinamibacterales bacterium]